MGAPNGEIRASAGGSDGDEVSDARETWWAIADVGCEQVSLAQNPRWDERAAGAPQVSSNCGSRHWDAQALGARPTQPLRMRQALPLSTVAEHSDFFVDSSAMKMRLRVGRS